MGNARGGAVALPERLRATVLQIGAELFRGALNRVRIAGW